MHTSKMNLHTVSECKFNDEMNQLYKMINNCSKAHHLQNNENDEQSESGESGCNHNYTKWDENANHSTAQFKQRFKDLDDVKKRLKDLQAEMIKEQIV